MDNKIIEQWIVKRKGIFWSKSLRLLVKTESGRYFMSLGETGEFSEMTDREAEDLIQTQI